MPNSSNDWNRNRRGSPENRDDNYDRSDYDRNRNYWNDYEDNTYNNGRNTGNYGYSQSTGNYGNRYEEGYSDRNLSGDDYRRNRDTYSRGSGNYSNTGYGDWNRRDRGYRDDNYGYGRNRDGNRDWWDKTKDEVSSWFGDEDAEYRRKADERNERNYRGRGPKGYTRSDERIKEDVNDRLSDDRQVDATDIEVAVDNCEVTLTGTVNSRWEKRHAEDIVETISGVKNVENRLKVNTNYNSGSRNDITSPSYRPGESNR